MNETPEAALPIGFRTAGIHCGIKSSSKKKDLALFVSDRDCTAHGVFTTNKVCGAPVQVSRERVPRTGVRAVIINSGNANTCTGSQGLADAKEMTQLVAEQIESTAESVLICSTGVIGHFLPMDPIRQGIPQVAQALQSNAESLKNAATAMMTTDTYPKIVSRTIQLETGVVHVTGVAKGAAMIAPNMATMLATIMTDLELDQPQIEELLPTAVNQSFNCISVEGHTSTSDTVLLLANGASGVKLEDRGDIAQFQAGLNKLCIELAQHIIRDAEGAEHFVTVDVEGAADFAEAELIAKTVANDVLVKTAITGNDPNWGRIVSACGRTGCLKDAADLALAINNYSIFKNGQPVSFDEARISDSMQLGEVQIDITLPYGSGRWRIWTSDLTSEYVRLNSEYTT